MEEAEANSFNEVEADGVSSKEVGTSNADALPTKYKFKSLRFEENGSQPTSMMNKNGSTSKAKYALLLGTNLHCSLYYQGASLALLQDSSHDKELPLVSY